MLNPQEDFGTLVGILRERKGVSQARLAAFTNSELSERTIRRWEDGTLPSIKTLKVLVKVCVQFQLFLPNEEESEAKILWKAAQMKADFDLQWFNGLLQEEYNLRQQLFVTNYIEIEENGDDYFSGREEELKWLSTSLEGGGCVWLCGIGGQGKTTLAKAYIENFKGTNYRACWLSIESGSNNLDKICDFLNIKSKKLSKEKIENINQTLFAENIILMLDNFERAMDGTRICDNDLRPLVQSLKAFAGKSQVIIISRTKPEFWDASKILELQGLDAKYGGLLLFYMGLNHVNLTTLKMAATQAKGHPLALKLLAGLFKESVTNDPLELLLEKGDLWDSKLAERLFREIWKTKITETEQIILKTIALLQTPVTNEVLYQLTMPNDSINFRDTLKNLAKKQLISQIADTLNKTSGFDIHPLLSRFIQTEHIDSQEFQVIHRAAADYFKSLIPKILPNPKSISDVSLILSAIYHLNQMHSYKEAFDLFFNENLYRLLEKWGEYSFLAKLYEVWLKNDTGKARLESEANQFQVLNQLGWVYYNLGQWEDASNCLEKAVKISQETNDKFGEQMALGTWALVDRERKDYAAAIAKYEKGLVICREIKNWSHIARHLGNLGTLYRLLGDLEKAVEYLKEALEIGRQNGDLRNVGIRLNNLGNVYLDSNQTKIAATHYKEALKISDKCQDFLNIAKTFVSMGQLEEKENNVALAIANWRYAIYVYQKKMSVFDVEPVGHIDALRKRLSENEFTSYWNDSENTYQKILAKRAEKDK